MKLTIYSRRWGHDDTYDIDITESGWDIKHVGLNGGSCARDGKPYLFRHLEHDGINYPEALSGYMEWLWERANEQDMEEAEIQNHLDELGNWIQITEKNSPGGLWDPYK